MKAAQVQVAASRCRAGDVEFKFEQSATACERGCAEARNDKLSWRAAIDGDCEPAAQRAGLIVGRGLWCQHTLVIREREIERDNPFTCRVAGVDRNSQRRVLQSGQAGWHCNVDTGWCRRWGWTWRVGNTATV